MKIVLKSALLLSAVPLWAVSQVLAAPAKTTPAAPAKTAPAKDAAPAPVALPKGPTGVAAEVNNERIPSTDVDRIVEMYKSSDKSLQQDSPEARQALKNIRDTVIDDLVARRLLVQEANRQKITPDAAKVDQTVAEFKKGFKTDAEMRDQLAKQGKKPEDLRTLVSEVMQSEEVQNRWMADATVTEAEIAKFYRDNIKEWAAPEGFRARHILLAFGPNISAADKIKLKTRAEALLKQARTQGADFAKLAQENSNDTGSKDKGGDLGALARGETVKPFEDAVFAAKAGDIIGPIETQYGYHIIKVEEKIPARTLGLDEVRDEIRGYMLENKKQETVATKMRALIAAAKIKKYA